MPNGVFDREQKTSSYKQTRLNNDQIFIPIFNQLFSSLQVVYNDSTADPATNNVFVNDIQLQAQNVVSVTSSDWFSCRFEPVVVDKPSKAFKKKI